MRFTINQQTLEDFDVTPTETLLSLLRRSSLTGTKEGCASGDCGACTVMVGHEHAGKIHYHTINACIAPASQYSNHHIVTIEGLSQDSLHPAQQAMVDCHGSQCGFCTPGFVMSIAALAETNPNPEDRMSALRDAISGNLCRCTGYKPIIKAGLQALETGGGKIQAPKIFDPQIEAPQQSLSGYFRPTNLTELNAAINAVPNARLIRGGTDLMLEITQLYREFDGLIDLAQVDELDVLMDDGTTITIGAAVAYTQIEEFFAGRSSQLIRLLHRLGSRQIRNSGSIGGNLGNGSPIADMPPILLAWDAKIQIGSADGSLREVAITDFYKGYRDTVLEPNEYIVSVSFPSKVTNQFHRFYKNSKRIEDDISSVMGAFSFDLDDGAIKNPRVAYGGMAATPIRLIDVEASLEGQLISEAVVQQAADLAASALNPLTDVRASADYRKAMAVQMLVRSLRELNGEELLDITEAL